MKKVTFFLPLLLVALFACTNGDDLVVETKNQISPYYSTTEAINLACKAFDDFYPSKGRKSLKDIDVSNIVCVTNRSMGRSGATDTLLYVVNTLDDNGSVVLSARRCVNPVMAVTESGRIDNIDDIDNPGLKDFIYKASRYVNDSLALYNEDPDHITFHGIEETYDTIRVEPRTASLPWGQSGILGLYCPNGICGCVPLSCAIAFAYFEQPSYMTCAYQGATVSSTYLYWWQIKNNTSPRIYPNASNIPDYIPEPSQELYRQLARAGAEIGFQIHATYNPNSTSGAIEDLYSYLNRIPTNFTYSNLTTGSPNPRGLDGSNSLYIFTGLHDDGDSGHTWVVDGCISYRYRYYEYYEDMVTHLITIVQDSETTDTYAHMNWGWFGRNNGYFRYNSVYNSLLGTQYDGAYNDAAHSYNAYKYFKITL